MQGRRTKRREFVHASVYEQLAQFFRLLADIPETEIAKAMKIFQPVSVR